MTTIRCPRRTLRRLAVASVLGLLLPLLPLPGFEFVTRAVGATEALPAPRPAGAEELAALDAASEEPIGGARVTGSAPDADRFSAIGVVFDRAPTEPVLVRVRTAAGGYGPWRELHREEEDGPDRGSPEDRPQAGTEPLWVGDGEAYEVNVAAADAGSARVVTVHERTERVVAEATPMADAVVQPPFGIGTRASWGARAATSTSYASSVRLSVVHHSASSNAYTAAAVPSVLRSIQAFHMDGRGWSDIAYNFVVDKYGGIWEGRGGGIDKAVIGAHAQGFNTGSTGVMVIGDYTAASPTAASLESVAKVIGWKMAIHRADPAGTVTFTSAGSPRYPAGTVVNLRGVVGHGDVGLTSCPGDIASSLPSVRTRAQEWTEWVRATSMPVGSLDTVTASDGTVRADGWGVDPASGGPALIRLTVAGVTVEGRTGVPRPDVQAVDPSYGPAAGFSLVATGVRPGLADACVTVVNEGSGAGDLTLGCRLVRVGDPDGTSPVGRITGTSKIDGGFDVAGWVADRDGAAGARSYTVEVDGITRATARTGADRQFWSRVRGVTAGWHRVCIVVQNSGAGLDTRVDCWSVDVRGASPFGRLEQVVRTGNRLTLAGWALDPEGLGWIHVDVVVGGRSRYRFAADQWRNDVSAANPGFDPRKGYTATIDLPPGDHRVCVEGVNVGGGANSVLGCTRATVVK
jgi:hypothetical protein